MITSKTKGQERKEIKYQVAEFLNRGGKIQQVEIGATGVDPLKGNKATFSPTQKVSRHLLTTEILAVDARRAKVQAAKLKRTPTVAPKKLH